MDLNLKAQAELLTKDFRRKIIMDYKEIDLHKALKELFQSSEPDYLVEITHGPSELGKDLVIVKSDKFTKEVIAVVVKRGNIKGKTSGDVDDLNNNVNDILSYKPSRRLSEIESQINQALKHPAEMKSIFKELPVSKVFVVLAGEISNHMRRRLTKEIAMKVEIFDINRLIDNFTEYYPQIFFEEQIVDFLQKKINELEEYHRRSKSNKSLSDYFVNPLIKPLNTLLGFDMERLKTSIKKKKLPFSELLHISQKRRKLILSGDPGTGKTGAMAKLTIDRYRNSYKILLKNPDRSNEKMTVPLFIHAREFLKSESVENLLTTYFESVETKSRFEVDLLIVDGLDEIDPSKRSQVIHKLDEFSEEISCSYILTTRKIDLINTLPDKYAKYELLPFEFRQALKLVTKLTSEEKILEAMREALEKIQSQYLLGPLSLMLLIELVEEVKDHEEIPASVTELYDRFFDMILGREDKEKGIEILFEYLIKKKFLGELAYYQFLEKNRFGIPKSDFKIFLNSYANKYGWNPKRLEGFAKEIERTGVLNQREEIAFKHRSFLDYFAAFHIHEKRGEIEDLNSLIVDTYFDDFWGEVAFFYIGLRREITQDLLKKIYSYSSENPAVDIDKLLGARLLQAGWHSPTEQHLYAIRESISYIHQARKYFQEIITTSDPEIPGIVSDFFTLGLTDHSFKSGILANHTKEILKQLIDSESHDDTYGAVALFWSVQRFLKSEDVEQNFDNILGKVDSLEDDSQKARILLLMPLIKNDKETRKRIGRRIKKLAMKSPKVFEALAPTRRKGFR